jgi:hypothetical protein
MSVTLHIFFAGLIAFVPSPDGRELTVLVPAAGTNHVLSDHSTLEPHRALLIARSAGCQADGAPGLCGATDAGIASLLFAGEGSKAPGELQTAILQGAVWELDGLDLQLTAQEGSLQFHDFDSVANLNSIVPGAGIVDPALLRADLPAGRLAARLTLRSGEISADHLVHDGANIPILRFRTLQDGREAAPGYSRPLADWVQAEVQVPGNVVELTARPFGGGNPRTIRLTPDQRGQVEILVMNVVASPTGEPVTHEPDKHFELYYDLTAKTPLVRPVPYVPSVPMSQVSNQVPQPSRSTRSDLLAALRLGPARGVYDRLICPVAQLAAGQ